MPYEIVSGNEEELVAGDIIEYGGEEFTVVEADNYSITVGLSERVDSFSADAYMEDEINNKWSEMEYSLKEIEESFGKIETIKDVRKLLKVNETLERLHSYSKIEKDVLEAQTRWNNIDSIDLQESVDRAQKMIENSKKFIGLLKDGVVAKEKLTPQNIVGKHLEEKYGLEYWDFWNKISSAYYYNNVGRADIPDLSFDEVTKKVLEREEISLEKYKEYLQDAKNKLEGAIKKIEIKEK